MNDSSAPLQLSSAEHLSRSLAAITALCEQVPEDQGSVRPETDSWSLNEILGHLLDEEREDFRARIQLLLEDPCEEWPAIDPETWVEERQYRHRSTRELLRLFQDERQRSIGWLRSLDDPDWYREKEHPSDSFSLRAGDLLLSWVAHDLAHIKQLARWHLSQNAEGFDPFRDDYAF
ncbi:MAG: DinB family protein [Planctomycetota bacterium]|nr:DinB family protein [Planctomycetota bacterium]